MFSANDIVIVSFMLVLVVLLLCGVSVSIIVSASVYGDGYAIVYVMVCYCRYC